MTNIRLQTASLEYGKKIFLYLFFLCSFINTSAEWFNNSLLIKVSKPLLMILLLLFLVYNVGKSKHISAIKWMILALITSNAGDILLLFAKGSSNELFFLAGLASFLFTHLFYSLVFHQLSPNKSFRFPPFILAALFSFWLVFMYILWPSLEGVLQPAVILYSLIILMMVYFAWRLQDQLKSTASRWVLWGALLFLLSDSCIGINKFATQLVSIPKAGVVIMSTYILGQLLIVLGVIGIIKRLKTGAEEKE